jgi:hypothetical protein
LCAQHYEYAWQRAVKEYAKTTDDAKNVNEVQLRFECCAFNPVLLVGVDVCVGRGNGHRVGETVQLSLIAIGFLKLFKNSYKL